MIETRNIPSQMPVLIAGPTASGKSALALKIAQESGGVIVNADALQVFDGWRILTARPPVEETVLAPHALYGHVPFDADYSVGHWLRDVKPLLTGGQRPIIVGGTGLYFTALTEGLAEIPPTPPEVRAKADAIPREKLLIDLDAETISRIDNNNRARVQRAWEVLQSTGRPLAEWQDNTPPPLLPLSQTKSICLMPDKHWLNERIEQRFHLMVKSGALEEAKSMLNHWNPNYLSSKAIGAPEMIAHLKGEMTLEEAIEAAVTSTRQFAKRQRTWFRARMKNWEIIPNLSTES